jgi:hypothetical protein
MKTQEQQDRQTTEFSRPTKRRSRGRPFQKGNPGRRPGSLNRSTLLAQAITDADKRELLQIGLARAKAGDSQMLKFFLERFISKEPPLTIALPTIKNHADLADAYSALLKAVSIGELTPAEVILLTAVLRNIQAALPDTDIVLRMQAAEKQLAEVLRQYDPQRTYNQTCEP